MIASGFNEESERDSFEWWAYNEGPHQQAIERTGGIYHCCLTMRGILYE